MSNRRSPSEEYLDRLAELLPPREVARVRMDVESLILEHAAEAQASEPELDADAAKERALAALGPVEDLADEIASDPLKITLATRRLFVTTLAILFFCHLLLSVVLTVAGSESAAIPGLLGPLPKKPFSAVLLAIVTIFLIDTGALLVTFVAIGKARPRRTLPQLRLPSRATRKGAVEGLVLLVLLAVILNWLLDAVFSVKHGDELRTFLSTDFHDVVPFVNGVLAIFAVRHLLTLWGRGDGGWAMACDVVGSLLGVGILIMAATGVELVHMPAGKLGQEAADVLDNLIERVFLVVLLLGALLLMTRFVRQGIRLWRHMRT